eukprot:CAMPEP_0113510406 /NCGR_PEP_ID=MMETSP0014_2-20120614/38120_1 /TAXON_ID=2857 /ORGANISM="Nitzschia sp." /LENGTH=634 /DNA_ID=CAMNT_0000406357 /DNA_START=132 /DNA_END=2036 /DNA_ORIENTATION=+ /assembly_acc=CAM_ASM_000159
MSSEEEEEEEGSKDKDNNNVITLHPTIINPSWDPQAALKLLDENPPKMKKYTYGTAGFRFDATVMDAVLVRVGIFCTWWYLQIRKKQQNDSLSSQSQSQQQDNVVVDTIGIMVTASHNDESYNGVKLVDPMGEILADDVVCQQLTDYVNGSDSNDDVKPWLDSLASSDFPDPQNTTCIIHVGHDTRSHSPSLTKLAVDAIQALGGKVIHHGVTTTPLLHHTVAHQNQHRVPSLIPIRPDAVGYYHLLASSYLALLQTTVTASTSTKTRDLKKKMLVVDCACGVGYPSMDRFNKVLNELRCMTMPPPTSTFFEPINGPKDGILNELCGSEHVLKIRGPPKDYANRMTGEGWKYAASFDGDADRIAFFGGSTDEDVVTFDGDKITTAVCAFLQTEVAALEEACASSPTLSKQSMTLGAVQTAYANGASTKYLRSVLGDENVLIAKTGVRHCHHAAKEFDIGVYFEANGHGTVVFGPKFYSYLSQAEFFFMENEEPRPTSLLRLRVLPSLINQAVGDALSDLLLVDAILHIKGWDLNTWNSLYADLPSRMTKMKVKDRSVVETNENDTICLAPSGVQDELNVAMTEFGGRCFVRPSGTEDVVRVYAEAPTPDACYGLSLKAEQIVYKLCGGVGDPPK